MIANQIWYFNFYRSLHDISSLLDRVPRDKGAKKRDPPPPRHLFFSSLFPPYSLFHNWCFDRNELGYITCMSTSIPLLSFWMFKTNYIFWKTTMLGINYNASQETTPRLDFQGGSKLRVKLLATYIIALHPSSTGKKYIVKLDLAYRWRINK